MHDALGIQGIPEEIFSPLDPIIDEGRFEKLYASWLVSCFNFPGPLSVIYTL
jgi:hypothetical protein